MKVDRDSWHIVEIIIRRYPEKKREYEEYISDIMSSTQSDIYHGNGVDSEYTKPQSVTEAKALKMTSVYADKLKKEIQAVEFVYNGLRPEEQRVMRERYWRRQRKNVPYDKMVGTDYSTRQMKRIVKKIISQVGIYLGEIK